MISLPRLCAAVFAFWGVLFLFLPGWSNDFAALNYSGSKHAEDWTQLVGLFSLSFAVLLNEVHRSAHPVARRIVAIGVLSFALPCALLMTYWQLIPDRRWIRLDIMNILLLYGMAYASALMIRTRRGAAIKDPAKAGGLTSA